MKAFISLFVTGLAFFIMSGCSGDQPEADARSRSRVVEETEMPYTYEERQYAATREPDLGRDSRRDMERAEDHLRESGEDLKRSAEHGMDAVEDIVTGRKMK